MAGDFTINGKNLSKTEGCYFIAEIGNNHQGDLSTALKMIEIAAACGAQAVKFQKRHNRSLYTREYFERPYQNGQSYGETYGQHREALEFGMAEYQKIMHRAERCGVDLLVTPFDRQSLEFCEGIGVVAYKIASGDVTNTPLIAEIAKTNKPVILSTGASTMEEVELAYKAITKSRDNVCLLHCVSAYPAQLSDLNLTRILSLSERFPQALVGYSGHEDSFVACVVARTLGAKVMEKHFTLDRQAKGTDHKFSLDEIGLRKQIDLIGQAEKTLIKVGADVDIVKELEAKARAKMGKGVYARIAITAGTTLEPDMVCYKSPGTAVPPYMAEGLFGRRLRNCKALEEPLLLEDFE